jgi:SAM-dependent methyltransferase
MTEVVTSFPLALHSDDHRYPRGTANDNTHGPAFVDACGRIFGRPVRHLDLGCAGGGLVRDFFDAGHYSVGIDGSDYSKRTRRAEWRVIPDHLFTADIAKPFQVSGEPFDVITAWDVLEHIREGDLPLLFDNIVRHLAPGGMFVASVATFPDEDPASGARWHVSIRPRSWWEARLCAAGLVPGPSPFVHADYVRGSGNGPQDWDAVARPDMGFHVVARRP